VTFAMCCAQHITNDASAKVAHGLGLVKSKYHGVQEGGKGWAVRQSRSVGL
jgi:hypothetical protein